MRKFLLVMLSGLVWALPVGAVSLADFSGAFQVEAGEPAPYYAVSVPLAVYAGAHKPKLEDLRFFNSEHVMLPHAVYRRFMDPAYEEPVERLSALKPLNVKGGVLLDLRELGRSPVRFEVKWQSPAAITALETSNDARTWQRLAAAPELARQSFSSGGLTCLVVPAITSRYVRLVTDGQVSAVRAALPANLSADADPQRLWMEFEAKPAKGGQYYLDGRGFMPFDRLKLKLVDGRSAHVRLYARNRVSEPWQLLSDDTFYRYRFKGEIVTKDTVLLRPAARRFFKLETDRPFWQGAALAAGWTPDRLIFVAKGTAPYILAYGSDKVERFDPRNEPALKNLAYPATELVKEAKVGKPVGTSNRVLLIAGFLLVLALVAAAIWVVLRKPDEEPPILNSRVDDE